MAASIELRKKGFEAEVFESLPQLGGILSWGIPGYRLDPKSVGKVINDIKKKGVVFKEKQKIGRQKKLSELMKDFDAVLLAIGEGKAKDSRACCTGTSSCKGLAQAGKALAARKRL